MDNSQQRLAVLIDADNASYSITKGLLSEIAKYGTAHVKRIYGDWASPNLKNWKDILQEYALQPIQQFAYTKNKNATDSAMIIDAMDLLYTGKFDGFCIVSSDSDFTRLASRIREGGLTVYGFGEKKTPQSFRSACDKFIYTEILKDNTDDDKDTDNGSIEGENIAHLIRAGINAAADENGWAFLGSVGQHITKQSPEFDPRNYGYAKLKDLVQSFDIFEIEEKIDERAPHIRQIYIKNIEKPKKTKTTRKSRATTRAARTTRRKTTKKTKAAE